MPADIINLRKARKAKTRADKAKEAEAKRRLHGRSKAEKEAQAIERERAARLIEGHRRDPEAE